MENIKKVFFLAAALFLTGCGEDDGSAKQYSELNAKIQKLSDDLTQMKINSWDDKWKLLSLTQRFESKAYFTPSSKGYLPVWTAAGNLLVSLKDINKYANGYKLTFEVGNPTLATFNDVKVKLTWNKAFEKGDAYEEWKSNERSTEVSLDAPLYPGKWNIVTVTISPAKEEDTGSLEVSLDTSKLSLSR